MAATKRPASAGSISYSTVISTGPSSGRGSMSTFGSDHTSAGVRSLCSDPASGQRRASATPATRPAAAIVRAVSTSAAAVTSPHVRLPIASPPCMTSWKTARVRARTQPGATRCAEVLSEDRTVSQHAPVSSRVTATSSAEGT
jgi:hypothetical protein